MSVIEIPKSDIEIPMSDVERYQNSQIDMVETRPTSLDNGNDLHNRYHVFEQERARDVCKSLFKECAGKLRIIIAFKNFKIKWMNLPDTA